MRYWSRPRFSRRKSRRVNDRQRQSASNIFPISASSRTPLHEASRSLPSFVQLVERAFLCQEALNRPRS